METSTSSIIGALGGGSGVDMVKLASDLAAARFATRIKQLESKSEKLDTQISAASSLRSSLSQLASALGDRIRTGDLAPQATIGNPSVASVSALSGARASSSYSLEVQQLASSQTLVGKPYSSDTELVGEGTLTLRFGEVSGGSFAEDASRSPVAIVVGAGDTLADVAAAVNSSGSGVRVYVANGASGAQLVFKGQDGLANGFTVEGTGASAGPATPGSIDYLSWGPASDVGELRQSAQDAEFLFDTIAMTSSSNKVSDLPGGLSLNLTGTNVGAPTQIGFAEGSTAIEKVMGDFVAALNDIASQMSEAADPLNGVLGSDAGARRLKRDLSGLAGVAIMPNAGLGKPRTLGDLGLSLNRDGTFRLDNDRLQATLTDEPQGAREMFTAGLFGIYATIDNLARSTASASDPGTLAGSIKRYNSSVSNISEQLAKIAEQQSALTTRLTAQFSASDRAVSASQSTLSFLRNQIALWNTSSN